MRYIKDMKNYTMKIIYPILLVSLTISGSNINNHNIKFVPTLEQKLKPQSGQDNKGPKNPNNIDDSVTQDYKQINPKYGPKWQEEIREEYDTDFV